jgi:hypothetical protein
VLHSVVDFALLLKSCQNVDRLNVSFLLLIDRGKQRGSERDGEPHERPVLTMMFVANLSCFVSLVVCLFLMYSVGVLLV